MSKALVTEVDIDHRQFQKALSQYLKMSGRTLSESLNIKAYFIVKRTMRHTKKAEKADIRGYIRSKEGQEFIGKLFGKKRFKKTVPKNRKEATKMLVSARIRSRGYLAAGWGLALQRFGKEAKASRRLKGVTTRKGLKSKSEAVVAKPGMRPVARFANMAGFKTKAKPGQKFTQAEAMRKFGEPIFQRAIKVEMAGMRRWLEKKMAKTTKAAGGGP